MSLLQEGSREDITRHPTESCCDYETILSDDGTKELKFIEKSMSPGWGFNYATDKRRSNSGTKGWGSSM